MISYLRVIQKGSLLGKLMWITAGRHEDQGGGCAIEGSIRGLKWGGGSVETKRRAKRINVAPRRKQKDDKGLEEAACAGK